MNVKELIEALKQYPDDMEVIVQSYEDGYDPVTNHMEIAVKKMENKEWYYGVFDDDNSSKLKMLLLCSKFNREEKNNDE